MGSPTPGGPDGPRARSRAGGQPPPRPAPGRPPGSRRPPTAGSRAAQAPRGLQPGGATVGPRRRPTRRDPRGRGRGVIVSLVGILVVAIASLTAAAVMSNRGDAAATPGLEPPVAAAPKSPTPRPAPTPVCVSEAGQPGSADPWGGCWPGPQNTGYPRGLPGDIREKVELTTYRGPLTIDKCGVVIDKKVISGDVLITAGNGTHDLKTPCVTIKNSLVKGVIHTDEPSFGPVVVRDTEVAVPGLGWWENIGRYNVFVTRVNSHGSEGVIKCADYCTARDSWVHGMNLGGEYHYNAFGGNGIESKDGYFVIEHNWASCGDWKAWEKKLKSDAGCSAGIGFYGDFAPIRNVTIHRNFIAGATIDKKVPGAKFRQSAFCLNPGYYPGKPYPAPSDVKVTQNVFGRGKTGTCGMYGPSNSLNAAGDAAGNVWKGNTYEDGTTISRPEE